MLLAATLLVTADDDFKFGKKHFSNIYVKKEKSFRKFLASTQFQCGETKNHKVKTNKQKTATYLHSKLVNKSVTVYRPEEKALLLQKILKKITKHH